MKPLDASKFSRLLETPQHCLRFVSLLGLRKNVIGDATMDSSELWLDNHAFLGLKYGSSAEHACLLCSLLIGFSLNA